MVWNLSGDFADPPRAQNARPHRAAVARVLNADDVGDDVQFS